jgi:tetratricopeptide (TPR) repeat protein
MNEPASQESTAVESDETLEEKIYTLFEELDLAIKWDRPSILFAMYESEFLRKDISKLLENRLANLNQTVTHFNIDEKQFDVPMILIQNPDHEHTVFFITGLKWGGGKGGFNAYRALNMRREFFVDNQMRVVLWLTKKEASNLPRHAPDFWAFRHRVVEFTEENNSPRRKEQGIEISWDGWKASELTNGIEEKISLREAMLSDLPEGMESLASRTDLLYMLASYYWAKGDFDKSSELLERGSKLAASIKDPVIESQFWAGKGNVLHSKEDFNNAVTAYRKALDFNGYNTFAWNNLAITYTDQGENSKAIEVCKQAIEHKPKNSSGYAILGDIYRQTGQFEDAKDCYQNASRLEPKVALNWINLGNVFLDQQRYKESLRAYLKASRLTPSDVIVWKKIGDVYIAMNRPNDARKTYKKAITLAPEDEDIAKSLADLENKPPIA